jgi:diguanylate cyclase (GGDEF)-like protein
MKLMEPQELTSATFKTPEQSPLRRESRDACIVYIYPTGPLMGSRYPLGAGPILIGRSDDCQVPNVDASVSRHHARIELKADGNYYVTDLGSTNGTFVNNVVKPDSPLRDGDYLRIGNCIYRYLAGDNLEAEYHEEIYRLTVLDALTEIPNRRYFQEFLDREIARAARHRRPLALALLDIDHFKAVNDEMGHIAGDMTLRQLVGCVRGIVRRDELFARYGGEEFALILPELDAAKAHAVCQRIRQTIESHKFAFNKQTYPITVSIGIGMMVEDEEIGPNELIRRADAMLYEAKRTGRNRICPIE